MSYQNDNRLFCLNFPVGKKHQIYTFKINKDIKNSQIKKNELLRF